VTGGRGDRRLRATRGRAGRGRKVSYPGATLPGYDNLS
jgi:hypothetical protein